MKQTKIEKNQTVYNYQGIEATYIQELDNGKHLVAVALYDAHGDEYDEVIQVWGEVLTTSPMPKLAKDLVELQERIDKNTQLCSEINSEIFKKKQELSNIDSDILKRKNNLKQHKELENLELFIQGKITHFIFIDSGRYEIKEFNESIDLSSRYDKNKFKLLTLYGNSKGDLDWGISESSDGSGNIKTVYPCISKEDAESKVQVIYHELLNKLDHTVMDYTSINTIDSALELGITLKEDIAKAYEQRKEVQRQESIVIINKQIEEFKKQLQMKESRLEEFMLEGL
jgi:hypothetical protein